MEATPPRDETNVGLLKSKSGGRTCVLIFLVPVPVARHGERCERERARRK
jgi:hypothetical protein